MVLELLLNPKIERSSYSKFLFVGFLYTVLSSGLAFFVFPSQSSIASVFFIVLSLAPFVYHMLEREEIKNVSLHTTKGLFLEYKKIILVLLHLFLGILLGYILLFIFFSDSLLFSYQLNYLSQKMDSSEAVFSVLFSNNLIVLFLCLAFSFFFGFGAIFILTLNASMIGVAIGNSILLSFNNGNVFSGLLLFFQLLPHGIFEIVSYFLAGIAGSFLSFGILHKEYLKHNFSTTLYHTSILFICSIFLLFIGALVEVFLFPLLNI